jgi:hypothetical protein
MPDDARNRNQANACRDDHFGDYAQHTLGQQRQERDRATELARLPAIAPISRGPIRKPLRIKAIAG